MNFKTIRPSRRALLSLAVMATLAPAGVGLQHLVSNHDRTAATIADLGESYEGGLWSNKEEDTQNTPATLEVASKVRTRFTGTLTVDGDTSIPITGGVSAAGRVSATGALNQAPNRLRVVITGQLSAGGKAIIGTYTATGQGAEGRINDRGSIVLLLSEAAPES